PRRTDHTVLRPARRAGPGAGGPRAQGQGDLRDLPGAPRVPGLRHRAPGEVRHLGRAGRGGARLRAAPPDPPPRPPRAAGRLKTTGPQERLPLSCGPAGPRRLLTGTLPPRPDPRHAP